MPNKLTFVIERKKSIKSGIKNYLKFNSLKYVPQLFERIIYSLKKCSINLIGKPTGNLKELAYRKIDPLTQ